MLYRSVGCPPGSYAVARLNPATAMVLPLQAAFYVSPSSFFVVSMRVKDTITVSKVDRFLFLWFAAIFQRICPLIWINLSWTVKTGRRVNILSPLGSVYLNDVNVLSSIRFWTLATNCCTSLISAVDIDFHQMVSSSWLACAPCTSRIIDRFHFIHLYWFWYTESSNWYPFSATIAIFFYMHLQSDYTWSYFWVFRF